MFQLIRSEFYKLSKSRVYLVCCLLSVLLSLIGVGTFKLLETMMQGMSPDMMEGFFSAGSNNSMDMVNGAFQEGLTGLSMVVQSFTQNSVEILMAVFASVFLCSEFSSNTIRHTVSRGFSRGKIYFVKMLTVFWGSFVLLAIFVLFNGIFGTLFWRLGDFNAGMTKDFLVFFGMQLLLHFALASLFGMFAILLRSHAGVISVNLCLILFVPLLVYLVNLLLKDSNAITDYWILQSIVNASQLSPGNDLLVKNVFVGGGYLVISYLIGSLNFQTRDIN